MGMQFRALLVTTAIGLMATSAIRAAEPDPYAALAPFVGKVWRGEGSGPDGKPMVDVTRWDWALGGKAIRTTHALTSAPYGGETMIFWDKATNALIYHYFTTAGFHTQGTMVAEAPGRLVAEEAVSGHPTITRVRSVSVLDAGGSMSVSSEYLDGGTWKPGHKMTYRPAPAGVEPIFPDTRR